MYIKKHQIIIVSMLALLAMTYTNLFGRNAIFMYIMCIAVIPFMILCDDKRIRFDKMLLTLFLTQLLYIICGHLTTRFDILMSFLMPVVGYLIGGLLARSCRSHEEAFRRALYTIAIAAALYEVINFLLLGAPGTRQVPDLWTRETFTATNLNSRAIYVIVIFYHVMKYESRRLKFVFGILTLGAAYVSIATMARTNVYTLLSMIAIGMIYTFISTKAWRKRSISKNKLFLLGVVVPVLLLVLAFFLRDIIDAYTKTLLPREGIDLQGAMEMSRWQFWLDTIDLLILHPEGMPKAYYAHNLVLDVGRVSGVLPMFFMLAYVIQTIVAFVRLLSLNRHNIRKNTLYILTYVGLFWSFMIEPVLEGRPLNFVAFCLLMGIMTDELANAKHTKGVKLYELHEAY